MSIAADRRSHVVLHAGETSGMSPADRATLARLLLERGLEVSCRHASRPDDPSIAPPGPGVLVESGGDTPSRRVVESGGADPASLAETILRESGPAAAGPAWKPWFPVIDYSRCTNCMQCLSFCLFDVYGVSADQKIQVQNQSNCKTECPGLLARLPRSRDHVPEVPARSDQRRGGEDRRRAA